MRQSLASERMIYRPRTDPAMAGGAILRSAIGRPGAHSFRDTPIYRNEVYDPFAPPPPVRVLAENSGLRRYPRRRYALASDRARYELVWAKGGNITSLRRL